MLAASSPCSWLGNALHNIWESMSGPYIPVKGLVRKAADERQSYTVKKP